MVCYMAHGSICHIGHHVTYYGMAAAIKDYLHLRIVGAYHLPAFLRTLANFFILKLSAPGLAILV